MRDAMRCAAWEWDWDEDEASSGSLLACLGLTRRGRLVGRWVRAADCGTAGSQRPGRIGCVPATEDHLPAKHGQRLSVVSQLGELPTLPCLQLTCRFTDEVPSPTAAKHIHG